MLNKIIRRKTRSVSVGNVAVGSDSIISVQSMTNTLTHDYAATLNQSDDKRIIRALEVYKSTGENMTSLLGKVDKNSLLEK